MSILPSCLFVYRLPCDTTMVGERRAFPTRREAIAGANVGVVEDERTSECLIVSDCDWMCQEQCAAEYWMELWMMVASATPEATTSVPSVHNPGNNQIRRKNVQQNDVGHMSALDGRLLAMDIILH